MPRIDTLSGPGREHREFRDIEPLLLNLFNSAFRGT